MTESWPLIYIRWVDAYDGSGGWTSLSDIDDWKQTDWEVDQVGWLYEETENYLILINLVAENVDSIGHRMKIPKPWIRHREEIKLGRKQRRVKSEDV